METSSYDEGSDALGSRWTARRSATSALTGVLIQEGKLGNCRTRKNIDGRLFSLIYGTVTSTASDPIEKKPLYHFYPGSYSYSMGSVGCSFHCEHCQNWTISQADIETVYTGISPRSRRRRPPSATAARAFLSPITSRPSGSSSPMTALSMPSNGVKSVYVTNGYATPGAHGRDERPAGRLSCGHQGVHRRFLPEKSARQSCSPCWSRRRSRRTAACTSRWSR